MKKKLNQQIIDDFMAALSPEYPNLTAACCTLECILESATELMNESRETIAKRDAELAALRAENAGLLTERRRDALDGQSALNEANNEVMRLRARIAQLEEAAEWHPGSEPPDSAGMYFVEWSRGQRSKNYGVGMYQSNNTWFIQDAQYPDTIVHNWRELPPPPQEDVV